MKNLVKISVVLIAFFCNQFYIYSQNLVYNGSFEEVYSCPTNTGQIEKARFWSNPSTGFGYQQSPDGLLDLRADLLSECSTNTVINPLLNPNINFTAFDGQNFAGIVNKVLNRDNIFPNDTCYFREYIQGKLKHNLSANKKYLVSFKVLLASGSCDQITNKLSLLFTYDSLFVNQDLCGFLPQIVTNTYFNLVNSWQHFETTYFANGTENYFSIGIFLPNYKLDLINNPNCNWPFNPSWFIGYAIDDVKIVCIDPNGCDEISTGENISAQKLTIFPNPIAKQVNLKFSEPFNRALTYSISDLQGRQLLQGSIQNQETVLDISNLPKGIYLLNISDANGNKWNKKIIKGE